MNGRAPGGPPSFGTADGPKKHIPCQAWSDHYSTAEAPGSVSDLLISY